MFTFYRVRKMLIEHEINQQLSNQSTIINPICFGLFFFYTTLLTIVLGFKLQAIMKIKMVGN